MLSCPGCNLSDGVGTCILCERQHLSSTDKAPISASITKDLHTVPSSTHIPARYCENVGMEAIVSSRRCRPCLMPYKERTRSGYQSPHMTSIIQEEIGGDGHDVCAGGFQPQRRSPLAGQRNHKPQRICHSVLPHRVYPINRGGRRLGLAVNLQ